MLPEGDKSFPWDANAMVIMEIFKDNNDYWNEKSIHWFYCFCCNVCDYA